VDDNPDKGRYGEDPTAHNWEEPVTAIRFSGGEVIEVNLSLDDVRDLLQRALANGVLLELESETGAALVINPQQVQYLQNGSEESFPPAEAPSVTAAS
jgi:hypothetical protein